MELLNDLDISIRSWRRYPELLKNSKARVFSFGVLLTLLFFLMTAAVPAVGFMMRTGGYTKMVTERVPEFTFSGGKLSVQGSFHYADGYRYFDINTDPSNSVSLDDQKTKTQLALNSVAMIADSEKMIFKTDVALPGTEQGTRMIRFSDYANLTLTKADLISFAPVFYGYVAMLGAIYFFMNLAGFFIAAAVIASFGRMFARMMGLRLDFGTVYQLTVYSRSVPVLLRGGLWLMGLMFAEYSALGFLYSIFVLTRVFRYLYEEGRDILMKADLRRREQGMYSTERRDPFDGDAADDVPYNDGRIPTPKTPDAGTGVGFDRTRPCGAAGGNVSVRRASEDDLEGASGREEHTGADLSDAEGTANGKESAAGSGRAPAQKSPDGDREARVPDISTVAKPVAGKDLTPSNGWSFGTREPAAPEPASPAVTGGETPEIPEAQEAPEIPETPETPETGEKTQADPADGYAAGRDTDPGQDHEGQKRL